MDSNPQRPKGRKGAISALDAAIEALNHTGKISHVPQDKAVFDSVTGLLTMIRVRFQLFRNHLPQVYT